MKKIDVCWIIPSYAHLRLIPGRGSPLEKVLGDIGEVLSYDGQINYPHSTAIISTARQLQSALGDKVKLNASILNLAAVPRQKFVDNSWTQDYLSQSHKVIKYGESEIEARRIGLDISQVSNLQEIVKNNDLIVIPSSFETHIPELKRLACFLKANYDPKIMTSGTGVEGHEEELLESGFDAVFVGTVTDRGEEVLDALVNENYKRLSELPGIYSNLGNRKIRNLGARNFRREKSERKNFVRQWKSRLSKYHNFVDVDFKFIGRPDLITELDADSAVEYCCAMQDLPYETVSNLVKSRDDVVFAADQFFLEIGCPRSCDFCHSSGKGFAERNLDYSIKLLDFYKDLGVTDLIPTDDQIFLRAIKDSKFAQQLVSVYQHAKELGFTFFYGNGVETYSLAKLEESSKEDCISRILLELFVETASYVYLPYENIQGLTKNPKKSRLPKLHKGKRGFERVLGYLNDNKNGLEVGTNIIFGEQVTQEEIIMYYQIMDQIASKYPNLNLRYNGFFMIPSNCAPHIDLYRREYDLTIADEHPELKIVSVPSFSKKTDQPANLERKLAWNIEARNNSATRRKLRGGTYEIKEFSD